MYALGNLFGGMENLKKNKHFIEIESSLQMYGSPQSINQIVTADSWIASLLIIVYKSQIDNA